jgi:hypothetical protein
MRWSRKGEAFVCESWTPDLIADRDERLGWMMRHRLPWSVLDGQLIPKGGKEVTHLLDEAMRLGRREWKPRMRALEAMGVPVAMPEGSYAALGVYPLESAITGSALSATEAGLITAANQALYMPIPARSILAPQAFRMAIGARYTVTTTPGSLITSFRLGNTNASVLLGTSASVALTASLTNAFVLYKGDITVYKTGIAGSNATANGIFDVKVNTAVSGAFNSALWGTGATPIAFDSTVAPNTSAAGGQIWIGVSDTGATNHATINTDQIHWMDWN